MKTTTTKTTAELFVELCEPLATVRLREQRRLAGDLAKKLGAAPEIVAALHAIPIVNAPKEKP